MRITVPQIEIKDTDGFSESVDIFNRKPYGEALLNLINNTEGELVIALDAPWGEGKSTFIKMWRGLLAKNGITNFYFDAFANDYQRDALLALSSGIYQLIDTKDSKSQKEYKEKAVEALKVLGRAGLKVGIKTLTAGMLDDTVFKTTDTTDDVADEASEVIDKYIEARISEASENEKSLKTFKDYLGKLSQKLGNGNKIIFIIDELDRCKPSFAISMLESVKHIFSSNNIAFLLVMNRSQIESILNVNTDKELMHQDTYRNLSQYGQRYRKQNKYESNIKTYITHCLKAMNYPYKTQSQDSAKDWLIELLEYYKPTLREIEKCISNFAIVHNSSNGWDLNDAYRLVSTYLSIIKVLYPNSYQLISIGKINYQHLLQQTQLENLFADYWKESEGHPLKWIIRYSLADEIERKQILSERKDKNIRVNEVNFSTISSWLDSFEARQ